MYFKATHWKILKQFSNVYFEFKGSSGGSVNFIEHFYMFLSWGDIELIFNKLSD